MIYLNNLVYGKCSIQRRNTREKTGVGHRTGLPVTNVTQEVTNTDSSYWAPIKAQWKTCPNMNSTAIQRFFLYSTKILLELRFTSRSSHHIQAPLSSLQYLESSKKIHTNLLTLVSWKGKEIGVEVDKQNLSLLTPHTSEFCPSYRKTVSLRVHSGVDTVFHHSSLLESVFLDWNSHVLLSSLYGKVCT